MRRNFYISLQCIAIALLQSGFAAAGEAPPAHALAQKFALESEQRTKPAATSSRDDYEKEMLDAARREAAERDAKRQVKPETKRVAPPLAEQPAKKAETPPAVRPVTTPRSQPTAAPETLPRKKIRIEARIATPTKAAPVITVPAKSTPAPATAAIPDGRATVLVVLTGASDGRPASSVVREDPILCAGETCYLSDGLEKAAKPVRKTDALSTRNAITNGAGACKGRSRCAFRDIALSSADGLQIVDLGIMRHNKREPVEAQVDTTCAVEQGDLVCGNPRTAPDYRIWLIPEAVAARAGPEAIEAALADDLPEANIDLEGDK